MRRAAIVAPIRTAVGKFGGSLASMTAGELGAVILKALIERTKIDPGAGRRRRLRPGLRQRRGAVHRPLVGAGGGLPDRGARLPARPPLRLAACRR